MATRGFRSRNLSGQDIVTWYIQSTERKKKKNKPANQEYFNQQSCLSELSKRVSQTKAERVCHI